MLDRHDLEPCRRSGNPSLHILWRCDVLLVLPVQPGARKLFRTVKEEAPPDRSKRDS
jgi:hypothetical protein